MYQSHSLPKSYGSYSKSRGGGSAGVVTQAALVILLVVCGGLGLMQLSSRAQVRDLKIHHEAVQEELTYTKNHLHHVEAQLANKEAEYTHLAQEVHQYSAHHSIQELETLRTQKRVADQTLATSQDEVKKLKEELDAAHALIDAYKHHLSDEVASHHTREETWMAVQGEWEKLEVELNAEIESLKAQLNAAHVKVNEPAHHEHAHPQHIAAEVPKHDPIYDNLPPAHVQTPPTQQQQQQYTQHVAGTPAPAAAVPVPVPVPTLAYVPTPVPTHAAPVPVPVQQQQQQHTQVPVPSPAQATTPPHPAEAPHLHHNDHYQHHDGSAAAATGHDQHTASTGATGDWNNDYQQHWDAHNLYADYPGFVDEHAQPQDVHSTWQHHDDAHTFQHDQAHVDTTHHAAPAAATQQHTQQHVPLPADTHAGTQHADPHAAQQQQHTQPAAGHADPHAQPTQQQQAGHTDPHAQHTQQQQHQEHHQQHHVVDDLAMKLGLGGHYEDHQPEQHGWH